MSTFNTKNKLVDATLSGRSYDCRIILARFYTGHTCMQARAYILPFSWHNPTHNNEALSWNSQYRKMNSRYGKLLIYSIV